MERFDCIHKTLGRLTFPAIVIASPDLKHFTVSASPVKLLIFFNHQKVQNIV